MNVRKKYRLTHNSFRGMRERCINANHKSYPDYGGSGIKVCKEWDNFAAFFKDMGEKPKGMSLDRKDSTKGYYKDNCRWATTVQQNNNLSSNKCFLYKGVWYTMAEGARKFKMHYRTLQSRIRKNWPNEIIDAPFGSRLSDLVDKDGIPYPGWVTVN